MLEVARVFAELVKKGWRPLRTIEFASWYDLHCPKTSLRHGGTNISCRDGEEANLIGSTEHVEARIDEIRRNAVAYLNVDVAVTGADFQASASPALHTALLHTLERVVDPVKNQTLRALWAEKGSVLQGIGGGGSDYLPFQDMAGTSSLDMSFSGNVLRFCRFT